jgi:hypothetical protein
MSFHGRHALTDSLLGSRSRHCYAIKRIHLKICINASDRYQKKSFLNEDELGLPRRSLFFPIEIRLAGVRSSQKLSKTVSIAFCTDFSSLCSNGLPLSDRWPPMKETPKIVELRRVDACREPYSENHLCRYQTYQPGPVPTRPIAESAQAHYNLPASHSWAEEVICALQS